MNDFGPYVNNPLQGTLVPYNVAIGSSLDFNDIGNSVLRNDISAVGIACLEIVYGGGSLSNITSTGFMYTPSGTYIGQAMLKYRPVNSSGIQGNITYIFINVLPPPITASCTSPIDGCNLVCDGGFKNSTPANFLPRDAQSFDLNLFNWRAASGSPDFFIRNSVWSGSGIYLGIPVNWASGSTFSTGVGNVDNGTGTVDSHNGAPNDTYVGQHPDEAFYGRLTNPLAPGNYQLSFWVRPSPIFNKPNGTTRVRVSLNSNIPSAAAPYGTSIYSSTSDIAISSNNNGWTLITQNFTVNSGDNFQFIAFEQIGGSSIYQYLDDVSIVELNKEMYQLTSSYNPNVCNGQDVTVNFQLCMQAPAATNASDIVLQFTLPYNISIAGGDFNNTGQLIIPQNTFSTSNNCINFSSTFHLLDFVEDVPISIILNNSSGGGRMYRAY